MSERTTTRQRYPIPHIKHQNKNIVLPTTTIRDIKLEIKSRNIRIHKAENTKISHIIQREIRKYIKSLREIIMKRNLNTITSRNKTIVNKIQRYNKINNSPNLKELIGSVNVTKDQHIRE